MEIITDKKALLKNIDYAQALAVKGLVDYQEGDGGQPDPGPEQGPLPDRLRL